MTTSSVPAPALVQASGSPYRAWAIDNGLCFGHSWSFIPQALYAYYPFHIYTHFDLDESAACGAKLIQSLAASEFKLATYENIPRNWFGAGDEENLAAMLLELQKRRHGLVASIKNKVRTYDDPPNGLRDSNQWQPTSAGCVLPALGYLEHLDGKSG